LENLDEDNFKQVYYTPLTPLKREIMKIPSWDGTRGGYDFLPLRK